MKADRIDRQPTLRGRIKFLRRVTTSIGILEQNLASIPNDSYPEREREELDSALGDLLQRMDILRVTVRKRQRASSSEQ